MNRSFALLMGFDYEVGGQYTANKLSFGFDIVLEGFKVNLIVILN